MIDKNDTSMKSLLKKYKLNHPVPGQVQEKMISRKSKIYTNILRSMGKVSILSSLIISIYFSLKKLGITLTLTKLMFVIVATEIC